MTIYSGIYAYMRAKYSLDNKADKVFYDTLRFAMT